MTIAMELQHIVLVEDSDDDYDTVREAVGLSGRHTSLSRARNGDQCMALLRGPGAERPSLVMMDLNTSGIDGRETLRQIKTDPQLKTIPVVVVTSSANPRDVEVCYHSGANAYHVKPVRYPDHLQLLARLLDYWLGAVIRPVAPKKSP